MSSIPKNNLRERMLKLGYKPDLAKIHVPILDNSRIIRDEKPTNYKSFNQQPLAPISFKPTEIGNIDDWSDFEEDE